MKVIITVREIINQLARNPQKLFLIDSLGAMLTAIFLFIVLRYFNEYVGMPQAILTFLSVIAVFFCIYSLACFFFLEKNWVLFIRLIGIANLLYAILTIGILTMYYPRLTIIGISYFLIEIAVICGLVYIELKVAKAIRRDGN